MLWRPYEPGPLIKRVLIISQTGEELEDPPSPTPSPKPFLDRAILFFDPFPTLPRPRTEYAPHPLHDLCSPDSVNNQSGDQGCKDCNEDGEKCDGRATTA